MYARVVTVQALPGKEEELLQVLRDSVVPAAQQQKGFRGYIRLTDHRTGKGMSITLWDTEEALMASEASGYLQDYMAKFGGMYVMPPFREIYDVSIQVIADATEKERPS